MSNASKNFISEKDVPMKINEEIETKVLREYDVAVCGGGFAGISAALAAARQGKKVVLFEKQYMLGGLGTAGLITIYLPLCDGLGHQVSFGIAEELFRLSILHGAEARYPENWLTEGGARGEKDKRFEVQYNAQLFAILAERLLRENSVDILYGTYVVAVEIKDDKISHIITENKSGRIAYKSKSVVDATGDCDIAHFADAPTETYKQGNTLGAWYYSVGKNGYKLNLLGASDEPNGEVMLVDRRFSGLDGEELSQQVCLSHDCLYKDFLKEKEKQNDDTLFPTTIATIPQIRMTRRIVGEYELKETELHTFFEDSIGMVSNWKKRGPVYEVPFRTLYSSKVKNLICAGRCTSVNEGMWDIMRVIPCCSVTGQAAGTAAALTDDFAALDVCELQMVLKNNGVVLHENELNL